MSGFVQQGAVNAITNGVNSPTITGVTAGNTLICAYSVNNGVTLAAPTDSAGQTWTLRGSVNGSTISTGIAYLLNANAGTHTLSWTTSSDASEANISEWNGITAVGGTPQTTTGSSVTSITSGSYTPSQANEVVIAVGSEFGTSNPDNIHCTTTAFQSIGTTTDSSSNHCIGVEQNGSSFGVYESNADIVTSTSAVTCTWSWTGANAAASVIAGFQYTPSGAAAPFIPCVPPATPQVKSQSSVDIFVNLLVSTLAVAAIAQPIGKQAYASAPITKYQVQCDQYHSPLPLGLVTNPTLLPYGSQRVSVSAPAVKYQPQVDVQPHSLTLGIPANPLLPSLSGMWDASAPAVNYFPQVDVYPNNLVRGIPAAAFLPIGAADLSFCASAPATAHYQPQVDVYPNLLATTLVPIIAASVPRLPLVLSAQQTTPIPSAHQPTNLLPLLPVQIPLLPLGAQTWDISAPQVKYQPQVDVQPYSLTLGIPAAAFLPLGASDLNNSASAPQIKYQPQVDAIPNLLGTVLAPATAAAIPRLPLAFEPQQIRAIGSADQQPNLLPLVPVQAPLLPLAAQTWDTSAPAVKYQLQVDVRPYPLTLGIPVAAFLPLGAADLSASASAPAIKYQVQCDIYQNLLTTTLAVTTGSAVPRLALAFEPQQIRPIGSANQQPNILPLGIPTPPPAIPLPLSAQAWSTSSPAVKYQPQVDIYERPITLGIPAPPSTIPLPLSAQAWSASAPAAHISTTVAEQWPNNLALGIPVTIPAWNDGCDSAPALKNAVYVDQIINKALLAPVQAPLLPLGAQTWDNSAPQVRVLSSVDIFPNLVLQTQAQIPLLPLGAQTWDNSAPEAKYRTQVDVYPNLVIQTQVQTPLLPTGSQALSVSTPQVKAQPVVEPPLNLLQTTLATPLLPVDAVDWFASAPSVAQRNVVDVFPNLVLQTQILINPAVRQQFDSAPITKYAVQADQYPNPLARGINQPPNVVQMFASAPAVKYQPQVDTYRNCILLDQLVVQPFIRQQWDSAPITKYTVQADQYPNQLARGINPPPPVASLLASAAAPITKYAIETEQYINTLILGYPAPPIIPVDAAPSVIVIVQYSSVINIIQYSSTITVE
jgi:hypothetical protein